MIKLQLKQQSVDLNTDGKCDGRSVEKEVVQRNFRALLQLQEGSLNKTTDLNQKLWYFHFYFIDTFYITFLKTAKLNGIRQKHITLVTGIDHRNKINVIMYFIVHFHKRSVFVSLIL